MRLVDLNVAIKMDNNDKVIEFLEENEGDIITLQESMRAIDDTVHEKYNNSTIIKRKLKEDYKYSFFGALWVAKCHIDNGVVNKDFGGLTEQGNEVISKFPIIEAKNIFYHKNYSDFTDITDFRKTDHGRALEQVIIQVESKRLQIINLHGIWNKDKSGDERTLNQCRKILEISQEQDLPTIIVGDFNLHPETESINLINEKFINLINEYDIKTTRPTIRKGVYTGDSVDDYIFVNNKIRVNDFKVVGNDVSDHYPLILDFEILD